MNKIFNIRKAYKDEYEQLFPLITSASGLVFDCLNQDTSTHLNLYKDFFINDNTKFSFNNTYVYLLNNKIVGCIIAYPADKEQLFNKTMDTISQSSFKFPLEALENTIYIDTLAVLEEYQGQGIAKELVDYILKNSDLPVSLLVEIQKEKVKNYYIKLGFTPLKNIEIFNNELIVMVNENNHN